MITQSSSYVCMHVAVLFIQFTRLNSVSNYSIICMIFIIRIQGS